MKIILDHFYQHLAGDVCFTVSLPPMFIEIPQPGTFQLTDLTMPGLDLVVDVADVVPQCMNIVELEFALSTLLYLLSLGVIPPDMTQEVFLGWQSFATLLARELLVRMMSLYVIDQICFMLQYFTTVNTEMLPERVLV